ncbi:Coiled-coil domain-containing protein 137, partial [Nipponia nippon]
PCSFSPRKEKKMDNMKPKHPDEQEIPFRLRELIKSREAMKRPDPGKRRAAGGERSWPEQVVVQLEAAGSCTVGPQVLGGILWGRNSLAPVRSRALAVTQLFRFQNKKLEKARKKKEEKKEAMLEKSLFQDTVAFGEVVTQPPTITSRPRGRGAAEQAGRKRLLLTSRLGQSQASPVSPAAPVSMARRRIVEEERARVIQAYRDIQRRKQQQREVARGSAR